MSAPTNAQTPRPENPSSLKPRYEIRQLLPEHVPWACAILAHSHMYHNPVWAALYPKNTSARLHNIFVASEYLVTHQINSGLSFGVFDTKYAYRTSYAQECSGKLYWNRNEPNIEETKGYKAEGERLLQQMDFPLVSIALSYDQHDPLDFDQMGPLLAALPHFGTLYKILADSDPRDPESWKATAPGQVLMRNATSTRHDYEGQGVMGATARWLRREAKQRGFRGIQIECMADAVTYMWSEGVEKPFVGNLVSEFDTRTWRDEQGILGFAPAEQRITKCWVDLVAEG
ncbi:hypothetical protein T440DRAFT_443511 [Plenodomus tracheiphilus IPT5]|uniref:N-acetyltransferase domain-containing protein n=1 Tax=Plenodomus tracheiphilus IPT5 TaxID=1408161 RepID=A0A6A7BH90_9PLEO|nr:hypothetical protein T440DRAFT_443511 [Plenodomus tracheiphilus IPT5]